MAAMRILSATQKEMQKAKGEKNEKTPEHDGHDGLDIGMSSII